MSSHQRYGGLSIQPVSEGSDTLELVARELDAAAKHLAAAAEEVLCSTSPLWSFYLSQLKFFKPFFYQSNEWSP